MKKGYQHITLLLLVNAATTSCINHIPQKELPETNITIRINGFEQTVFNDPSRATASETIKCLSIYLFTNEKKVQEMKQFSTDNDFGEFDLIIPYGDHQIVVVGHNGAEHATAISPENISFPSDWITDTFHYHENLTVDVHTPEEINITLSRSVAKFELLATDQIPLTAKEIRFVVTGAGNRLNAESGTTTSITTQQKTINIPPSYLGKKNTAFVFFTFLPGTETNIEVTATAVDSNNEVLSEKTFTQVSMQINRITQYQGEFFDHNASTSGSVSINDTWENKFEVLF